MSLDAVLHLRITTVMYNQLQAIMQARRDHHLQAREKRLHGLVRELLSKREFRLATNGRRGGDPRPVELTGTEPTRLLHIRVPKALLEELKSSAAGKGARGGEWEPMSLSGSVRARLWRAMRPEWSALPESRSQGVKRPRADG